jgi:RHS repeat-associated protein
VRSQLTDNLGSIAVETDGDGQPLSYEVYFPFGGTSVIAGRSELAVEPKVYRYSGKIADGGLGLYDYGVRYYPPWMSRWLNPDPTGAVNGLNLFQFVLDDPTSAVDSDGRIVWIDRRPGRGGRPPTITIRLNGVLVDNTHQNYTRAQMQAFARRLSDQIRRSYHGIGATVHFNARVSIRVSTVARRDDHVFRLVEPGQLPTRRAAAPHYVGGDYRPGGVVGYAPRTRLAGGLKQSNKIVYIRRDVLERRPDPASTTGLSVPMGASGTRRATLERTGPHEFGHTLNLDHPSPALPSNLMNQSTSPQAGMQISEEQVLHAEQEYEDGRLNGDDQGVDPRHLGP